VSELPARWVVRPLEQLLQPMNNQQVLQQGWSPQCLPHPRGEESAWGVLKTTAVQSDGFRPDAHKELPTGLAAKAELEVRAGDLLLTCAGPRARCGVPAIVTATPGRLMISGKMYRFRPVPEVLDARFLFLYLTGPDAQRQIEAMKTGISDSGLNLTKSKFGRLLVPVPPLDEQHRIVTVLEDHLSRLEAANNYLYAAEIRSRRLMQACRDGLTSDGDVTVLGDLLAEPLRNGHSAPVARRGGIRTLTLTAVTAGAFEERNTKFTSADAKRVEGLWLRTGDILVQRSNTPELVGTSAIYTGPDRWAIFPDLLIRVRVDKHRVRPAYAAMALMSSRTRERFRGLAKGLAGSMPKIDQAAIASAPMPIPDLRQQDLAIEQFTQYAEAGRRLFTSCTVATRRAHQLRSGLLTAAYRDEL
jgi:type I restriction enzyme S subunit